MVEQINKDIKDGKHCLVVSPNATLGISIRDSIEDIKHCTFCTIGNYHKVRDGICTDRQINKFFDEFDLYVGVRVPINKYAYYCTTPKYVRSREDFIEFYADNRSDPMLALIDANEGMYITHTILKPVKYKQYVDYGLSESELHGTFVK